MFVNNDQKFSVKFDDKIRDRLKDLQNEHNYTIREISRRSGISPNTYKNWFRNEGAKGSVKTLKADSINALAKLYDCTTDYIICESDNKMTDRWGRNIIHPITFETPEKLSDLTNYFKKNPDVTNLLHRLLVSAPKEVQKITTDRLFAWNEEIKIYNLLYGNDNPIKESFNLITQAADSYHAHITDATLSLASANFNFSKKRYEDALPKYLKIIYNSTMDTKHITKVAIKKVLQLESIWEEYPSALKEIFSENYEQILLEEQKKLDEQKKLEKQKTPEERKELEEQRKLEEQKRLEDPIERAINNQDFSALPKEYYKSIYKYFKNNGIELQNLKDYLETIY